MPLPPLYRQENEDSCALACLRMILGQHGIAVSENTLAEQANKQAGGVDIEDLPKVLVTYGLQAEIVQLSPDALADSIAQDVFPIVYLNRLHFDRRRRPERKAAAIVHAVICTRVSSHFVSFFDPLDGTKRRVSRQKFEAAQHDLRGWCVVCQPE